MRDEVELSAQAAKGERARQLLNDPMLKSALESMRKTVFHNIETSHFKSVEEREDLYKMLKAITAFEKEFKKHIDAGKKATSLLEKLFKGEK